MLPDSLVVLKRSVAVSFPSKVERWGEKSQFFCVGIIALCRVSVARSAVLKAPKKCLKSPTWSKKWKKTRFFSLFSVKNLHSSKSCHTFATLFGSRGPCSELSGFFDPLLKTGRERKKRDLRHVCDEENWQAGERQGKVIPRISGQDSRTGEETDK